MSDLELAEPTTAAEAEAVIVKAMVASAKGATLTEDQQDTFLYAVWVLVLAKMARVTSPVAAMEWAERHFDRDWHAHTSYSQDEGLQVSIKFDDADEGGPSITITEGVEALGGDR